MEGDHRPAGVGYMLRNVVVVVQDEVAVPAWVHQVADAAVVVERIGWRRHTPDALVQRARIGIQAADRDRHAIQIRRQPGGGRLHNLHRRPGAGTIGIHLQQFVAVFGLGEAQPAMCEGVGGAVVANRLQAGQQAREVKLVATRAGLEIGDGVRLEMRGVHQHRVVQAELVLPGAAGEGAARLATPEINEHVVAGAAVHHIATGQGDAVLAGRCRDRLARFAEEQLRGIGAADAGRGWHHHRRGRVQTGHRHRAINEM